MNHIPPGQFPCGDGQTRAYTLIVENVAFITTWQHDGMVMAALLVCPPLNHYKLEHHVQTDLPQRTGLHPKN